MALPGYPNGELRQDRFGGLFGLTDAGVDAMRVNEPAPPSREEQAEANLAVHIVTVSAALVGVCLTVIGLIQVALHLKGWNTPADNILAGDAVLLLLACLLAYASIRSRSRARQRTLERLADACFLLALSIMTLVCSAVAFELI